MSVSDFHDSVTTPEVIWMDTQRLAEAFVELADTLVDEFDLVDFLYILVDQCMILLDVSAVGLMLADAAGHLQVMASSSESMRLLELFALRNDDGPSVECFRTGAPVHHLDLAEALGRWPQWARAATDSGLRTVHVLPMRLRTEMLGVLNLFHAEPGRLQPPVTRIGQAMADVASIALIQERSLRQHETLIDQLQSALDSRVLIEQAKGVLAERQGLTPDEAFVLLRKHARSHNRRLAHLAAAVVNGTDLEKITAR